MPVPSPALPLRGKVALVTGAARRIGRALALELARAGADIGFTYRTAAADALALEQDLLRLGVRAAAVRADLTRSSAVEAALASLHAVFGRLDLLVNNVGRYEAAAFERISDQQWDDMLAANLTAPFLVSRAAIPRLRASGGGRIIHLTSVGALRAFPTHAHYCASKAGLAHLTRAMARALAPDIQVNAVAPGLIVFSPELSPWEQHMADRTPLQRPGTPADVALAVRFLATCNPFLTGQTLVVDGGLSLL
ncbi:MAG TPA: SDR family oxidoreductase [Terriglobales bacterium]|nr:SDR family oxidoreductase [Terriglobales bacterium]